MKGCFELFRGNTQIKMDEKEIKEGKKSNWHSGCLFKQLRLFLKQTVVCKRLVTKNHNLFLVGHNAIHIYNVGFAEAALGCFSPLLFTFLSEQFF